MTDIGTESVSNFKCSLSSHCNDHGSCTSQGICSCYSSVFFGFFMGSQCEDCQLGFSGADCKVPLCIQNVTCFSGTCAGGMCICNPGFAGSSCSECAQSPETGFWTGPRCADCTSGFNGLKCDQLCFDSHHCNGHGLCTREGCLCARNDREGYWTDTGEEGGACKACLPPYYGPRCTMLCDASTCSGHGTCDKRGCKCVSSARDGYFTGDFCTKCLSGYMLPSCTFNPSSKCSTKTCINGGCDAMGKCICFSNLTSGFWGI